MKFLKKFTLYFWSFLSQNIVRIIILLMDKQCITSTIIVLKIPIINILNKNILSIIGNNISMRKKPSVQKPDELKPKTTKTVRTTSHSPNHSKPTKPLVSPDLEAIEDKIHNLLALRNRFKSKNDSATSSMSTDSSEEEPLDLSTSSTPTRSRKNPKHRNYRSQTDLTKKGAFVKGIILANRTNIYLAVKEI